MVSVFLWARYPRTGTAPPPHHPRVAAPPAARDFAAELDCGTNKTFESGDGARAKNGKEESWIGRHTDQLGRGRLEREGGGGSRRLW